jgi:hypothetical protein
MEHLATNRCFVRGTSRESSYAEDCERHILAAQETEHFYKGKLRHLAKEGSAIMFIGVGYCSSTGYNPGLLQTSLLDITREKTLLYNGADQVPHVGGVGWRRKLPLTFCVSEALAIIRHTYLGSVFLDLECVRSLCLGAVWNVIKVTGLS